MLKITINKKTAKVYTSKSEVKYTFKKRPRISEVFKRMEEETLK